MKKVGLTISILVFVFLTFSHKVLAVSNQEILDSLTSEVYRIYNNTDFSNVIDSVNGLNVAGNSGPIRSLAGQVMMYIYSYQKTGNIDDLNRAKENITIIINKYPSWKQIWTSEVAMSQLAFSVWWIWPELDTQTKSAFYSIMSEEADYWTWALDEVKTNPNGQTIPTKAGRRPDKTNISFMTTDVNSGDHLVDTRAEENAWNAQVLATAYAMFPNSTNAKKWNEAAKCFAFHVITRNETYCGITTRTVSDDFTLGNHNLWPSPLYTIASITSLQQARFAYESAGLLVPAEFLHHIENRTNSEIWIKNVSECMDNQNYEITQRCHAGQDWGDRNLQVASLVTMYWEKLDNDTTAETLTRNILNYFNINFPGVIRNPHADSVIRILAIDSAEKLYWWKNIEYHPQLSAKYFALSNFKDVTFRLNKFPYALQLRVADSNQDNLVNLADFVQWKREFTGALATKTADFNSDGNVNLADFVVWKKNL